MSNSRICSPLLYDNAFELGMLISKAFDVGYYNGSKDRKYLRTYMCNTQLISGLLSEII